MYATPGNDKCYTIPFTGCLTEAINLNTVGIINAIELRYWLASPASAGSFP
jgi:hypothetical protein